eukprot:TRINITY_DN8210_c0_g1_i1.p1 TRINITY_DN8210_c0_g1~~TRINITY_DN8210_c0_g1_i1.p1  ORF type:complete len:423 (+),score=149.99 TRINITY_DN8210_c0_g1_i1:2-1270(+)
MKTDTPKPPQESTESPIVTAPAKSKAKKEMLIDSADRWAKWVIRTKSTIVMVVGFAIILYLGHLALLALIFAIVMLGLNEIMNIRMMKLKKEHEGVIPLVKSLDWYFFFATSVFIYGRFLLARFPTFFLKHWILKEFAYHFITIVFGLFILGFVAFVLNLRKGTLKLQFKQFAWTVMTILMMAVPGSFHVMNLFEGLFWLFFPACLVISNDIWAYIFGFFFGRTPLIKLSPKKTWEGFIGAFIMTIITSFFLSYLLAQYPFFICPRVDLLETPTTCVPNSVFVWTTYELPTELILILQKLGISLTEISFYPIQLHALIFGFFASLIAPFGGFFASGFKRAFKIKDFADTIPGHGGITDRMDCQAVMGIFAFVYFNGFIRGYTGAQVTSLLLARISTLTSEDQLYIYHKLQNKLVNQGVLTLN